MLQVALLIVSVASAFLYLGYRVVRRKPKSCGPDCGCEPAMDQK